MKRLSLIVFFMASTIISQAQKIVLNSLWRDSNIVINGSPTDWDQPLPFYDSKAKIQYNMANDATDLYIILKTMDDRTQMKILRTGMDVSIDISGKKKEVKTIRYPLPGDTRLQYVQDPGEPDVQRLDMPDIKVLKDEYALTDHKAKLTGFIGIPTIEIPAADNKYGVSIAIGWDKDNVFTYELKVPFRTILKEKIDATDTIKPVTVNVKINSFDVPQQINNGSMTDPSVSNSGMRNQGYGNQQQSTPNMSMPRVNDMAVSVQTQIRMKLAYK